MFFQLRHSHQQWWQRYWWSADGSAGAAAAAAAGGGGGGGSGGGGYPSGAFVSLPVLDFDTYQSRPDSDATARAVLPAVLRFVEARL